MQSSYILISCFIPSFSLCTAVAAAAKSLQSCLTLCDRAAHQAPASLGFSRQEYIKELYKKDLHDPDNHDGVITYLEPDILEHEMKWALGSITMNKASGVLKWNSS